MKDNEMKELFAAQRKADQRFVPGVDAVLARQRGPARPAFAVAGLAAVLVLAVMLFLPSSEPATEVSITEWESPTAFLLEAPGDTLFNSMPEFGNLEEAKEISCEDCF
jgi:hypothetical protein